MYVQTCEKVAVIIRVENNWQTVASSNSLIMLLEEIEKKKITVSIYMYFMAR